MKTILNKCLILAFNEEKNIKKTVDEILDYFDEIIIVNDKSKDSTNFILEELKSENKKIVVLENKKNFGAGKSMLIGIEEANKTPYNFLVKIDGDNQFEKNDIKELLRLAKKNNADFIKCDRFWENGIHGDIPKIRYLGNSFASLLIKLLTGNPNINDPLNGLFLFSEKMAKKVTIPKLFYRYGYPFFINTNVHYLNIGSDLKLFQFRNKIKYGNENSNLNPINVFLKLMFFTISYFLKIIKKKLRFSTHQLSAIVDIAAVSSLLFSIISLYMVINTRYFGYSGNQGAWAMLFVIFLINSLLLLSRSHKIIKSKSVEDFIYLN